MILLILSKTTLANDVSWARQIFENLTDEELIFWAPIISKVTPEEYAAFVLEVQEDKAELAATKLVLGKEREYVRKLEINYDNLQKKYVLLESENSENKIQAESYKLLYEHVKPTLADKIASKAGISLGVFAILWALTQ